MYIVKLNDGSEKRLFSCEFIVKSHLKKDNNSLNNFKYGDPRCKAKNEDLKPLIKKLYSTYINGTPRASEEALAALLFTEDYLTAMHKGSFVGILKELPNQTKRDIWNVRNSQQRDVLNNTVQKRVFVENDEFQNIPEDGKSFGLKWGRTPSNTKNQ